MKAYKIDLSIYEGKVREVIIMAVLEKAFRLGYMTKPDENTYLYTNIEHLFFMSSGAFCFFDDKDTSRYYYAKQGNMQEISAADFLALTTAKDEPTFKPFDKVLVMDGRGETWRAELFSHTIENDYPFVCTSGNWMYCIPYEGNEHLLGTTEEAK